MERIREHPILGKAKFLEPVTFTFNGKPLRGFRGEPIAATLLAEGVRTLRRHEESGNARGFYCAIGHCMECRLIVQGQGIVRSCLTPLEQGMIITEGQQLPNEITGRNMP